MRPEIENTIAEVHSATVSIALAAKHRLGEQLRDVGAEERAEILDFLLASNDRDLRCEGLIVMMEYDACAYAERCMEFLTDSERDVRHVACSMLAETPRQCMQAAVPALCDLLSHEPEPDVRYRVIEALRQARDVRAVDVLREITDHDFALTSDGYVVADNADEVMQLILNPDLEKSSVVSMSEPHLEREPRVKLGIFLRESGQEHEPELLDMALRRIGQALPGFRVHSFDVARQGRPARSITYSESEWQRVLASSEAHELESLCLYGCGGDVNVRPWAPEFALKCCTYTKWEPYREAADFTKVRVVYVEVWMQRESWNIADRIAESMKDVALFAANNLKLLQAYVSLAGVVHWEVESLKRYQRLLDQQADLSADHVVAPAWFCVVHTMILNRLVSRDSLQEKFDVRALGSADPGRAACTSIQLAPRISEVSTDDLRVFRDLAL